MIFVTDVDVARSVFSYNDPSSLLMAVHPSAKNILGPNNLAFMHGHPHKAIRKSFLALFTRKALGTYVELQDGVIRRHLQEWLGEFAGQEQEIRPLIRYPSHCFHKAERSCPVASQSLTGLSRAVGVAIGKAAANGHLAMRLPCLQGGAEVLAMVIRRSRARQTKQHAVASTAAQKRAQKQPLCASLHPPAA